MKNIWIDLDNSPHVPFFAPIARELFERGHKVSFTARNCFQVCGLADLHGLDYVKVGRHYGKNKLLKIMGTCYRGLELLFRGFRIKADVALSHGSRSQVIASKLLGIQSIVISDYEHTKGLVLFKADNVIVPEVVLAARTKEGHSGRVFAYPGIKEDVYVPEFVPDRNILRELGINGSGPLVTIRPPATEAHYHNPEAEVLFTETVDFLGSIEGVRMVILPRNEKKQGDQIRSRWAEWCHSRKIIIPDHVVGGLNLIWHSDLVISGGGTMNREAAALRVPVYSIFRGKIGAVDRYLSATGRLTLIEKPDDVRGKIRVLRRERDGVEVRKDRKTLDRIVEIIEGIMKKN
jgi:uncharacterized protein